MDENVKIKNKEKINLFTNKIKIINIRVIIILYYMKTVTNKKGFFCFFL